MFLIDKVNNKALSVESKKFRELAFGEKTHLQEWIADNPEILGEPLLIIQKEFSGWADTNERLDLLALDKDGKIVVIENKLDDSGRDVVWQALKYASYCATLKNEEIYAIYQKYLGKSENAAEKIVEFLDSEDVTLNPADDGQRINLVAANFRKEVLSTALWLQNHGIDITCVQVALYQDGERLYLDSEQVFPLKEAKELQIKLAEKRQEVVELKNSRQTACEDLHLEFWKTALPELQKKTKFYDNVNPSKKYWLHGKGGRGGVRFVVVFHNDYARVELYIDTGNKEKNKNIFHAFEKDKVRLENAFGEELCWEKLGDKRASRIKFETENVNINDRECWNEAIAFMTENIAKMYDVFKPELDKIFKDKNDL